jgi:hypothetical protein
MIPASHTCQMSPVLLRAASRIDAANRHRIIGAGEEIQSNARGVSAEHGEVDAVPARMRAERQGQPRADRLHLAERQETFELRELLRAQWGLGTRADMEPPRQYTGDRGRDLEVYVAWVTRS